MVCSSQDQKLITYFSGNLLSGFRCDYDVSHGRRLIDVACKVLAFIVSSGWCQTSLFLFKPSGSEFVGDPGDPKYEVGNSM